jgi:inner membrane protein
VGGVNASTWSHSLTAAKRRLSVFLKLASICVLILLLHIPLAMSRRVLVERQTYQAQATEDVSRTWGRQQIVAGPVLAVPYVYRTRMTRGEVVNGEESTLANATAYFLPETAAIDAKLVPEVRRRGIYDTVVYAAEMKFSGYFQPDLAAAGIEAERIDWAKARVYFGVSDLRGVRSVSGLRLEGAREAAFETAERNAGTILRLNAANVGAAGGARLPFAFEAVVQGTERLDISPVGKTTTVTMRGPWADPSFTGASLPATREVTTGGFSAEWRSSHFSRGFPQSWSDRSGELADIVGRIDAGSFGVRLARPVDGYSMVERARKYGVLFFVLIFTAFFLFEVTAGLRIHPLQYAFVGAALCLFFTVFLALAEFWPVGWAYAAAATACTAMVALYARSFLQAGWRTLVIAGGLGATYAYLYFVLKSQDYALIAGTAALFAALALVMFCTRRINWYAVDLAENDRAAPAPAPVSPDNLSPIK